jgi:hypothetical protein
MSDQVLKHDTYVDQNILNELSKLSVRILMLVTKHWKLSTFFPLYTYVEVLYP